MSGAADDEVGVESSDPTTLYMALYQNDTASTVPIIDYVPEVGGLVIPDKSFTATGVTALPPGQGVFSADYLGYVAPANGWLYDLGICGAKYEFVYELVSTSTIGLVVRQPLTTGRGIRVGHINFQSTLSIVDRDGSTNVSLSNLNPVAGDKITIIDDGTSNADFLKVYKNDVLILTSNLVDAGRETVFGFLINTSGARFESLLVTSL